MAWDDWLFGTPEVREQVSNLTPSQLRTQKQLENASRKPGAGGAFGDAADYYRSNLSNNPADFDAFADPEKRRYNEQIIPDLAEQFAGMGSGGLSSSGFQNSAVSAGTDLSERLAAIRAGLRQSSAQGLQNIGSQALQPHSQWETTQQGSEGLLSQAVPAIATAAGTALGGPIGGAFGNLAGNAIRNWSSPKGSSSPYGQNGPQAKSQNNGFSSSALPNFNSGFR